MIGPGTQIGRFKVLSLVGVGGMGEVYRAHDTKLHRDVAVKVLPKAFASNPERLRRFEREARATAALSHPNVLAIYDVGTSAGIPFLVEELLNGESLGELLAKGTPDISKALKIGADVARGLAAAHDHGIVHRDLKPGNVFLTRSGTTKILDFGLAKQAPGLAGTESAAEATTVAGCTESGVMMGTLAYMSPEQARGQVVDARTDIFSFGVMLYEMLAGRRPFQGSTEAATLASILMDEPAPLPDYVPQQIAGIVARCLTKDPNARFQQATELTAALEAVIRGETPAATPLPIRGLPHRRLMTVAALTVSLAIAAALFDLTGLWKSGFRSGEVPHIASLAVLPLENLSGKPEQDYLAEGIHEALIADLAQLSGLERVIARSSALRYKGSTTPLSQIAKELRVAALVTGAVLRSGERVRVTAHLIDPTTETELWARSYERLFSDVLVLQNEIVTAISQEIQLQLTPQEQERLATTPTVDPETYEAFLKGRFHANRMTLEGFEKGIRYLQDAVESDPSNPLPHAVLALIYTQIGHEAEPEAFNKARAALIRARELGGSLAETEAAFAEIALYADWNWTEADQAFRRAIEMNPSLAEAHGSYSWYHLLMGRREDAYSAMRRAMAVDPLNPLWGCWLGWEYLWEGRLEDALAEETKALELNPEFPWALHVLGETLAANGDFEEAIRAHERAVAASPATKWGLAHALAQAGQRDAALRLAAELEQNPRPMDTWGLALIYCTLGDKESALHWLEASLEARFSFMPWIELEPGFEPLHHEARFAEIVRRVSPPRPVL